VVRLAALAVLIFMGGFVVDWSSGGWFGHARGGFLVALEEAAGGARAMVHEGRVLWRVLLEPIAAYLILWVSGMWIFFALLWEALRSVLWEGSVQQ
jgi:hypothetical protein